MNATEIAAALGGKPSGNGWLARCPVHDDINPSLSISEAEGKLLLHCHAGCEQSDVIEALKDRGLWPGGNGSGRRELARYDYRDVDGSVRYQVVRFEPKDFRCYSPATDTWAIKGTDPVPYNLPVVKATLERGEPVVVVEGEKDADRLAALSIVATTNHGGVGNGRAWKHLAQHFPAGSRVILLGDADAPGVKHMECIGAVLRSRGVEVLQVPPAAMGFEVTQDHGKDVSDWLAAGHSRDELIELLAQAAPSASDNKQTITPDVLTSLVSFHARQEEERPARTWFAEGMVTPGFCMFTGKKAMGKTFLLLALADAIAEGKPFLGRRTTRAKVLYVAFELDELDTSERFKSMTQLSENAFLVHSWPSEEKGLELAEYAIRELGFQVIIFDTFLPLLPPASAFEINSYGDSTIYLKWRLMAKRLSAAICASWHEGKTPRDDYMLNSIGSTGMIAQADCVVSIERKRGDSAGRLWIGGNHAPETVIPFTFENGIFTLAEGQAAIDRLTPEEEKTVAALTGRPEGCTTAAVALAMGKSEEAARKSLGRLMARGRVIRLHRGLYCLSNGQTDNSGQFQFCPKGQTDGHGHPPRGGVRKSGPEDTFEDDLPGFPEAAP